MTAPLLPNLFGPFSDRLLADAYFQSLIPGGIGPGAPKDVTEPYAVMAVFATHLGGDGAAWRATAAVHGCATGWVGPKAPETVAWDIAAAAAAVFLRSRNVIAGRVTWTCTRLTDGPLPMRPDKSRGEATPVFWAMVRAQMTIHLH